MKSRDLSGCLVVQNTEPFHNKPNISTPSDISDIILGNRNYRIPDNYYFSHEEIAQLFPS